MFIRSVVDGMTWATTITAKKPRKDQTREDHCDRGT